MWRLHALAIAVGVSVLAGCGGSEPAPDAALDGGVSRADAAARDAASDAAFAGDAAFARDAAFTGDAATPADAGGGIAPCAAAPVGALTYSEHRLAARLAVCAAEKRCGGALAPWTSFGTACHRGFAADSAFLEVLVDDGSVCFDATAAGECLTALESGDCSEMAWASLGPCRGALRPMLAIGEACVAREQCFEGSCQVDVECPGTCVARPTVGGACASVLDCAPGLLCNGGTCEARQSAGERCDSWLNCEIGLACIVGECAPRLGEGERCAQFDCEADLYCYTSGAVSACRAREPAGRACDADEECAVGLVCSIGACRPASGPGDACAGDETCPRAFDCDVAAGCVPLPRLGEACDARGCWEGDCVGGACTGRGAGVVCSDDRDCAGYCDIDLVFGSDCVDPRPEGASCTAQRECADGFVCRAGACRAECVQ